MCYNTLWCWKTRWISKLNLKLLDYIYIQNNLNLSELLFHLTWSILHRALGWHFPQPWPIFPRSIFFETRAERSEGRCTPTVWSRSFPLGQGFRHSSSLHPRNRPGSLYPHPPLSNRHDRNGHRLSKRQRCGHYVTCFLVLRWSRRLRHLVRNN